MRLGSFRTMLGTLLPGDVSGNSKLIKIIQVTTDHLRSFRKRYTYSR